MCWKGTSVARFALQDPRYARDDGSREEGIHTSEAGMTVFFLFLISSDDKQ